MSLKEDSVSVQKSGTSHNIQVLRGRTGSIIKVVSDRVAIFRDRMYGDITFTDDVLQFSVKKERIDFRRYFPVGKVVYFDIEVDVESVKCLCVWVSKKQKPDFSCFQPSSSTPQTGILLKGMVYRGTVIKILPPFAFVVEIDSCMIPVLVFNIAFKPNRHAAKLCGNQPVSLYVSKGDTVFVTVDRRSPGKEIEWSAWEAWMEESNTPEPSTSSEYSFCTIIKKWQHKSTHKTEKKIPIMKGKLSLVGSEAASLESTDCSGAVFFHRGNAFLFGVPIKRLKLNQIFKTGEELSFLLAGDDENVASCVWFGPVDVVSQSFEERMNCILRYCMERSICDSDRTTIVQELGKQRQSDEEKCDGEDALEETFGCCAAKACSALSERSSVERELIGSSENKTDTNQALWYAATEQTTLLSASERSNIVVMSSVQNINSTTVAINKNASSDVTKQHTTASKGTSGIQKASGPTISNATAAPKQSGCTSVAVVTVQQNVVSANENHGMKAPTSNVFMDSAIQSSTSSDVAKLAEISMNTYSKVSTDSSKYNCNSASGPINQSDRATNEDLNSMSACISEYVDNSDESEVCGHIDSLKLGSLPSVSDTETEVLCSSNCDFESEFYKSIINKDVERSLKISLLSVLKKQVGESASQILAPHAMGIVKKGIDCMMQELMGKALSCVIGNERKEKNVNAYLQCGDADRLTITSLVQEWKEEMLLVANEWKAEKKKQMETVLDRAQKLGQISALYCSNMPSALTNSDDNSVNVSNDAISFIPDDHNEKTAEKSTLIGILQDFIQLWNMSDYQLLGTPKSVSEQGSQTISTGSILYLNCLSDL